jgi:hypothetical protein
MQNPADFTAAVTRTVTAFVPNGHRFENTQTGRQMEAGTVSFDCGHSYLWHPHGFDDRTPAPAPGVPMMCADCIQAALLA